MCAKKYLNAKREAGGGSDQDNQNENFQKVFAAEINAWVNPRRVARRRDEVKKKVSAGSNEYEITAENNLMGVALSGGGMRSATFCLGVTQALVHERVLQEADYLSTVSGGGYLGASITALCAEPLTYEKPDFPRFGVGRENFPYGFPGPQHEVKAKENKQEPENAKTAPVLGLESPALRHVRENANLLTRKAGLFDAETWATALWYVFSLLWTWLFFFLPFPTLILLVGAITPLPWLFVGAFLLAGFAFFWLLCLGIVQALYAVMQGQTSGPKYLTLERARGKVISALKPLLVVIGIGLIVTAILFGAFLLYFYELGALKSITLGFGGLAVAGSAARKLLSSGEGRKLVLKVALTVGGYVSLFALACVWYITLQKWALNNPIGFFVDGEPGQYRWLAIIIIGASSLVLAALAALRGPTLLNMLSLNFMYEMRIQRTWVVAAVPPKMAQQPIGSIWKRVWVRHDLTMGELRQAAKPVDKQTDPGAKELDPPDSPLQLMVSALNIPGSTGAEHLDRKSDGFVISSVAYGSATTGWAMTQNSPEMRNMRLSQGASISGAAVSPNMGVSTTPTLSIITTLLNIRLGAWVHNPRQPQGWKRWASAVSERFPGLFWKELLGSATHTGRYVYLSDGGHFENLGIYELLRRRCRYIIAVDATGEAANGDALNYGGIGIPLRLARVDFGVEVDINLGPLERDATSGQTKSYYAVGRIRYPRLRGEGRHGKEETDTGYLVLIKSGLVQGTLTPDILNYLRQQNPRFPNDSTLDQQFDQAQFESYRQLGYIAGRAAAKGMQVSDGQASKDQNSGPEVWFKALYDSYQKGAPATQAGH